MQHLGFETVEAFRGRQAIGLFERLHGEIRFVLLDHAMPEMSGAETFLQLRGIDPKVPVILTSGYSEPEVAISSPEARPAGFLKKPYRLNALKETLRAALNAD